MTRLTVRRPYGDDEVFTDSDYHAALNSTSTHDSGSFRVYSYRVMPDQSLKVYAHKAKWSKSWSDFHWKVGKKHQDGMEVAHFRPSQWDTVRSG